MDTIEARFANMYGGSLNSDYVRPNSKVLAAHLANDGYQALDIGHIDSEYEWLQMGSTDESQS